MRRRSFLKSAAISTVVLSGFRAAKGAVGSGAALPIRPGPPPQGQKNRKSRGPTYDLLGYKRMILDLHYGTFRQDALIDLSIDEIADNMASAGIDSLLHFPRDHWGYIYTTGKIGPPHPNAPVDLFGRLQEALKAKNILTTGYLSVHWDEVAARRFPEWVMRHPDGSVLRTRDWEEGQVRAQWTYLCLNSPYRDYLLEHVQELIAAYDFPAFWVDIIGGSRPPQGKTCHCRYCRKLWEARFGYPLPQDLSNREYIRWRELYTEVQNDFYGEVKQIIKRSGKTIPTTHNYSYPFDHDDYVTFESQPGGQDYFRPSRLAKFYRAYANGREVECIGYRFNQPWDFTTKPVATLEFEVATALAHNSAITFVDQPHLRGNLDPRAYEALAKAFKVADELIPHVRGSRPYAEIALLASDYSADLLEETQTDFAGAYCILAESHLPFDVLADSLVPETDLSSYRVILVANTVHATPQLVAALRQYVSDGGTLLFTHRTATLDFQAEPLAQPSFGFVSIVNEGSYLVSFIKPAIPVSDTRIRVEETVRFRTIGEVSLAATVTPPALEVTEDKWISHNVMPGLDSKRPAAVVGEFGQGRYIYLAPRLFKEYLMQDLPSIREFVLGLIMPHYQPSIWLEGPRAVEAVYQRQGDELVVTLINGLVDKPRAGGHMPFGTVEPGYVGMTETVPIVDLRLHLRGQRSIQASDLQGNALTVEAGEAETTIEIPRLERYQLIRLRNFL